MVVCWNMMCVGVLWICFLLVISVSGLPHYPDTVTYRDDIMYPYGERVDLEGPAINDRFWVLELDVELRVFGALYRNISISDNSIINFGNEQFGDFDNQVYIPRPTPPPIIYALWTDWDFRTYGQMYARQVEDDGPLLRRASRDVVDGLTSNIGSDNPPPIDFTANYLLIITYFNGTDFRITPAVDPKFNTIQFVIATDSRKTYVMINYGYVEWYQVGQYARVGYDVGNGFDHYDHPNSGTPEIRHIDDYSNVNVDGRIMFQIDWRCDSDICDHHHGVCIENGFCLCEDGYTGSTCDTEIDECRFMPCARGNCTDDVDDFHCDCEVGFMGKRCDVDIDFCLPMPCEHGTCEDLDPTYHCHCWPGYSGVNCEYEINECDSCPCVFGECMDYLNRYSCHCDEGFTGVNCEENIDDCEFSSCQHGTCVDLVAEYMCFCEPGYSGELCDIEIDECDSNPCDRGTCVDDIDDYQCNCPPGYTGRVCETELDECEAEPCRHGVCFDGINNFHCNCDAGFTGVLCEENINDCNETLCRPHGICRDAVYGIICECFRGFSGRMCEIDLDECRSSPCIHGRCTDEENGYYCECYSGFKGLTCDIDVNECASSPCLHGNCSDAINGYHCLCDDGYTGQRCQTNINDCLLQPCDHGYCQDRVNGFDCICFPGYTGHLCEHDIDECESSPCVSGRCVDVINSYGCDCPDNVHGDRCHLDERPRVGTWGDWSDWDACTKPCDSGLQSRIRQCMRPPCMEENTQSQLCNVMRCHGDPTEPERYAVTLETSKSQAEIAEDEQILKNAVADALNSYCSENRIACCRLINITVPTILTSFQVFHGRNLSILRGYPMMVKNKVVRIKLLMMTTVGELRTACVGRVRRTVSVMTSSQLVYIPPILLQTAIHRYRERINQATCCWSLSAIAADKTVSYILMGVLIPVGVLLLILLVLCLISPKNACRDGVRTESMLSEPERKTQPALIYYPMYPDNRVRPRYDGYPVAGRY